MRRKRGGEGIDWRGFGLYGKWQRNKKLWKESEINEGRGKVEVGMLRKGDIEERKAERGELLQTTGKIVHGK